MCDQASCTAMLVRAGCDVNIKDNAGKTGRQVIVRNRNRILLRRAVLS